MKYWRTILAARRLSLRPGTFASYAPRRRHQASLATAAESSSHRAPPPPGGASAGEISNEPLSQYRKLVRSGVLRGDDHQTRIIQKLQDLHDKLVDYNPPRVSQLAPPSLFSRLRSSFDESYRLKTSEPSAPPPDAPKGLYLYGDVGTGKTMLMDLFYSTLPPGIKRKRRVHFHAFMIDVHKRVHAVKASAGNVGDPILPVARDLANEASVLCFDEFQVTDIADAMILRRLLESLLNFGVVCVMTSNRHPDDLYKNGIQRSSFIPTIELLKSQFEVTDLDSGTDYRRMARAASTVKPYHYPLSPETTKTIDSIFNSLTKHPEDPVIRNRKLHIWGRTLLVPASTSNVAKFTFQELCGNPLSAADYLEVTRVFGTVFLLDVWKMGVDRKDLARRFITFIDACYESKTRLFITSDVPIYQVFSDDTGKTEGASDHMRGVMDDLGLSHELVGKSSIFTGEEEIFAFARACSRLVQMESKEWAETAGDGCGGCGCRI
ncbi:AFG1-like ATPase [Mycena venus]|uniref:AFG1-like ATPase n=1 Tax=Mycena venus TaxID=2733690 RepID=A0A8H7CYW6_9AGAR|nr:AFG1-like ATPase [Mycena venus]